MLSDTTRTRSARLLRVTDITQAVIRPPSTSIERNAEETHEAGYSRSVRSPSHNSQPSVGETVSLRSALIVVNVTIADQAHCLVAGFIAPGQFSLSPLPIRSEPGSLGCRRRIGALPLRTTAMGIRFSNRNADRVIVNNFLSRLWNLVDD